MSEESVREEEKLNIDFKGLELDEETRNALDTAMSNPAVSSYLSASLQNRLEAIKKSESAKVQETKTKLDEFRETNIKLAKELEQFKSIDIKEYGRLKALGSDAQSASEKIKANEIEWQARIDGAERKLAEYEAKVSEIETQREKDSIRFNTLSAISEWNSKNPQLKIKDGAERVIVSDALENYKILDGKVVMQNKGQDYTTDQGFGSMVEWIGDVQRKQNPFCFTEINGGGASGSTSGGVTKNFNNMNEQERATLYREDPALYRKLRDKG